MNPNTRGSTALTLAIAWTVPLGVAAVLPLAACPTGPAQGDEPAADRKVKVTVVAILASDKHNRVDPLLEKLAEQIRRKKQYSHFTGFELARMTSKSLPIHDKTSFPLVDRETVHLTIVHGADENNQVQLEVEGPGQVKFGYRTVCEKFLPIVTRHANSRGERLIIAIRVQPCHGE